MKTREVTKEGLLIAGIAIILAGHFMGLCINGLCSSDWTIRNITMASIIQVSACIFLYYYLRDRAKELLENGYNVDRVINIYVRTRTYAVFGIFYSLALWAFPSNSDIENFNGTLLTTIDLFTISLVITIYASTVINYLNNKKMKRRK